mmetsp:Transcript_53638/g.166503  ORF Transcript_53638/g.166503 Transcript_53638/m.166503 type:complete len:247 (+) Transcript_53638:107-847(+)
MAARQAGGLSLDALRLKELAKHEPADCWWGPVDGPRPGWGDEAPAPPAATASCSGVAGAPSGSAPAAVAEVASLQQRLAQVRREIAARDAALAALPRGDSEAAALCVGICREVARRRELQRDVRECAGGVQDLREALRRSRQRYKEFEAPRRQQLFGSLSADTGLNAAASLGEDATETVWRECVAALEGEIRRKSARALELQRTVSRMEAELQQQLEANDSRIQAAHQVLQATLRKAEAEGTPGPH